MSFEVSRMEAESGIIVSADSIEQLFRGAAMGMLNILLDRTGVESRSARVLSANAESTESLLAEFLNELLSLILLDGFAVHDVRIGMIEDGFVVADISGQRDMPPAAIKGNIMGISCRRFEIAGSEKGDCRAELVFIS